MPYNELQSPFQRGLNERIEKLLGIISDRQNDRTNTSRTTENDNSSSENANHRNYPTPEKPPSEKGTWKERWEMTEREKAILERLNRKHTLPYNTKIRIQIVVTLDDPEVEVTTVAKKLGIARNTVYHWLDRWLTVKPFLTEVQEEGIVAKDLTKLLLTSFTDAPRSGTRPKFSVEQQLQILILVCEDPACSGRKISHWSQRELAIEVKLRGVVPSISPRTVGRFLKEGDLKPHRVHYWLNANPKDPILFQKQVQSVCELYRVAQALYAQREYVVSTDEKTGIQALERLSRTLPIRQGLVERPEHNYKRHGTLALIATLLVATGHILTPTIGLTRKEEDFLEHVKGVIAHDPEAKWIFICDQLNTHKSESLVQFVTEFCNLELELGVKGKKGILKSMETRLAFLQDLSHPIRFVYTPKHTSWLNQIECWFSILVRKLLKRKNFASLEALRKGLLDFIEYFNATLAKPFKWTYRGEILTV